MKHLSGQTDHWRFSIMGEETWAGVEKFNFPTFLLSYFRPTRRQNYEPSTQQIQSISPINP